MALGVRGSRAWEDAADETIQLGRHRRALSLDMLPSVRSRTTAAVPLITVVLAVLFPCLLLACADPSGGDSLAVELVIPEAFPTVSPPPPTLSPILEPSPDASPGPSLTPIPSPTPSPTDRPSPTPSPVVTETPTVPPSPSPAFTPIPASTTTPSPQPTASPTELPLGEGQLAPNELGWILVLEYHLIEEPEARWSRTPANFRRDVERLIAEGYYPINLTDLALGQIDVPAGRIPIVLTFDDSSSGQFRYMPDGTVDPECAVGILLEAAHQRPNDWRARGTFYVLLDVDAPDRILFGQPEWAERKLQDLVQWGMEVGSHSISHFRLSDGTPEQVRWQLAVSEETIEAMVPGYEVHSLSVPLGLYPADLDLLKSGEWEGQIYDFQAAVEVAGGPSPSPFSTDFDPYHIPRNQAIAEELERWLGFFQDHPELRYVSDGDPTMVTIPDPLPTLLEGTLRQDLSVQRYPLSR